MSGRLRGVLTGLAVGIAPLLLLDLARILGEAVAADGGETSVWWPVACYLATGLVATAGVAAGRHDRTVPIVGAAVLAVVALPTVPAGWAARLPELPLVPATSVSQAVAFTLLGVYLYAAVRGSRG